MTLLLDEAISLEQEHLLSKAKDCFVRRELGL
jgi:hypothetical protein